MKNLIFAFVFLPICGFAQNSIQPIKTLLPVSVKSTTMNNEIDKKIRKAIEEKTGYNLDVFKIRFNDGAFDAIQCFKEVYEVYGRYMTQDYMRTVLGLKWQRVADFATGKSVRR